MAEFRRRWREVRRERRRRRQSDDAGWADDRRVRRPLIWAVFVRQSGTIERPRIAVVLGRSPDRPVIDSQAVCVRLANLSIDCWELRSAEAAHAAHPELSWIPPVEERRALRRGLAARL